MIILYTVCILITFYFLIKRKLESKKKLEKFEKLKLKFINLKGLDLEFFKLLNNKNLIPEYNLTNEANKHVDYMIESNQANHHNALGRKKYFLDNGFKRYAEIVSYGYSSVESTFNAYLRSEKHNNVLKDVEYNYVGVSLKKVNGKIYSVIIFGEY